MSTNIITNVQVKTLRWNQRLADVENLCKVAAAAVWDTMDYTEKTFEVTIALADDSIVKGLNLKFRNQNKPTNVLSFPFEVPEMIPTDQLPNYLGDLVVCESVLINEAKEQHKSYQDHYTHLIIHGVLHLLGFDHIEDAEANAMENLEVAILAELGIADPYSPVST